MLRNSGPSGIPRHIYSQCVSNSATWWPKSAELSSITITNYVLGFYYSPINSAAKAENRQSAAKKIEIKMD